MPIVITWPPGPCFEGYPLTAVPAELVTALKNRTDYVRNIAGFLLRFQCFCELTARAIEFNDCADRKFLDAFSQFIAAFYSSRFTSQNKPWHHLDLMKKALNDDFPAIDFPWFPKTWNKASWKPEFVIDVQTVTKAAIDAERRGFWQGWVTQNSIGDICRLRLWRFYGQFGARRTAQLHEAASQWFGKGRSQQIAFVTEFSEWLSREREQLNFDSGEDIGDAVLEFYPHVCRAKQKSGWRLKTIVSAWREFARILDDHLLGRAWAKPLRALPMPRLKGGSSSTCNMVIRHGVQATHSLITPIPLRVSDEQAKELLFREIRYDVDTLLKWARAEVADAHSRLERRRRHSLGASIERNTDETSSINEPSWLCRAHAKFAAQGFSHLKSTRACNDYPQSLYETCWELGIATPSLLLAHATILVAKHPVITPAYLSSLELFDKHGRMTGLAEADGGWYLLGYKRRRGAIRAEQKVLLDQETLQVVRDLIELAAPLRDWLRRRNDKRWRLLFVATPSMGIAPNSWSPDSEACRKADWIAGRLVLHAGISLEQAVDLATRFSLRRLRSSAGVLVYLETGSVQRMAEALGQAKWKPSLLNRYLPGPIQEFFVERWIQIFQAGIICEALKSSPLLLRASGFESMAELDEFLENHALRKIPAHLCDPEGVESQSRPVERSSIVFGIEIGILTILASLEVAVRTATRTPCGRAIRWAQISERLFPHLESQVEQPELRRIAQEARRNSSASFAEELIYA